MADRESSGGLEVDRQVAVVLDPPLELIIGVRGGLDKRLVGKNLIGNIQHKPASSHSNPPTRFPKPPSHEVTISNIRVRNAELSLRSGWIARGHHARAEVAIARPREKI